MKMPFVFILVFASQSLFAERSYEEMVHSAQLICEETLQKAKNARVMLQNLPNDLKAGVRRALVEMVYAGSGQGRAGFYLSHWESTALNRLIISKLMPEDEIRRLATRRIRIHLEALSLGNRDFPEDILTDRQMLRLAQERLIQELTSSDLRTQSNYVALVYALNMALNAGLDEEARQISTLLVLSRDYAPALVAAIRLNDSRAVKEIAQLMIEDGQGYPPGAYRATGFNTVRETLKEEIRNQFAYREAAQRGLESRNALIAQAYSMLDPHKMGYDPLEAFKRLMKAAYLD